ncbi:MAG: hypothetical protein KGQ75_11360 [Sphingomonadales bacterium]|jgi:hypothetical protein|uniref:hypothetical protein n=1 Tax=Novosphingobium sp. NDB2Meth1 TaxID=1892847 RepID=UPI00093048AC|nr:hypothetical protein [Novosphingobium sp. NDB2Meth1]MBU6395162.1 hypothetical protein [Sphingomonadales bacterium]MBY0393171.1 hypothetical protein [Novosphingobium sp.]
MDEKPSPLPDAVSEALEMLGVDPASLQCDGERPRVVVVHAGLDEARRALREHNRDHVVMARVDQATAAQLDRWVAAGVAKSRSEAAALFIGEGLKLRANDLERLSQAIDALEVAKARLREEASAIFGDPSALD